jgi:putative RNA 2'-phosphotransferase
MGTRNKPARLAKFLCYVLGHRPDEFGLIPDTEGYVRIKDLLKACGEESGWRYVRRGHIQELRLVLSPCPLDMENERIRALDRSRLPAPEPVPHPPRLLYACVRRRAYATVREKGIRPHGDGGVVLSGTKALALRMGRRLDQKPILVTVHLTGCPEVSSGLMQFGETLYTCPSVPPGCLTGPPLARVKTAPAPAKAAPKPIELKRPGSFDLDPDRIAPEPGKKGRKKQKRRRPPWRT